MPDVGGPRSGQRTGAAGGVIRPTQVGGIPPRQSVRGPVSNTEPVLGPVGFSYVQLNGSVGNYLSTPDSAAFSALSSFSALVLVALDDWTPDASAGYLIAHRDVPTNNRSWALLVNIDGTLSVHLSNNGTALQTNLATSVATGFINGTRWWILETRNSTTGDIKVYTAPFTGDDSPPPIAAFTQLGTTLAGITGALFDSSSVLEVGSTNNGATALVAGKFWRASLYSGIYGSGSETLLRDMRPADALGTGDPTWVSVATGETWTKNGSATQRQERIIDLAGTAATASSATATLVTYRLPAGIIAWYDASDATEITDAGSGHVSQITGKLGPTLVQTTDANRPIIGTTTQNGRNTLLFDGSNDILRAASGTESILGGLASKATVFVVAKHTYDSAAGRYVFFTAQMFDASQGAGVGVLAWDDEIWSAQPDGVGAGVSSYGGYHWNDVSDFRIITARLDIGNATPSLRSRQRIDRTINIGPWDSSGTTPGTNYLRACLGAGTNFGSPSNFWKGEIAEVIAYPRVLSDTEVDAVETYLQHKWFPVVLNGKGATSDSGKATKLNRARPVAAKAATADSAKASRLNRARPLAAKAATSSSAKASLKVARPINAKAATSNSAKATLRAARPITAKAATSDSAKASRINRAAGLTAKAATSDSAKATLRTTRALTGKAAASSSAKAALRAARAVAAKGATSNSAKASTFSRVRLITAKAATSDSAKAVLRTARALAAKAAASNSANASTFTRAAELVAKAASADSAKATLANARLITAKAATSDSANASTFTRAIGFEASAATASGATGTAQTERRLSAKAATASSATGDLTVVSGPTGATLEGKAATASSAKAAVTVTRWMAAKASAASSASGAVVTVRRLEGKAATSSDGKATLAVIIQLAGRAPASSSGKASLSVTGVHGQPFVWTGTMWLTSPVKAWTGTTWVEYPLKFYNGSEWVRA